jgi:hypothetical protein
MSEYLKIIDNSQYADLYVIGFFVLMYAVLIILEKKLEHRGKHESRNRSN